MKIKKQVTRTVYCLCLISFFLSGCQMKKQVKTSKEDVTDGGSNIQYENVIIGHSKCDIEKVIKKCTGYTLEEALKNGAKKEKINGVINILYEKDIQYFSYSERYNDVLGPGIIYKYQYEMASEQYEELLSVVASPLVNNLFGTALRKNLPGESIDGCTKEEALKYCNQYAKLFGYNPDNSLAEVYALDIDSMSKGSVTGSQSYGPLKGINNNKTLSFFEVRDIEEKYPWTKEYEALYVVYKPCINGLVLDSRFCSAQMVYAPAYGRVVYIEAEFPFVLKEKRPLEEKTITKEEAVAEAKLLSNTANKDNIKIEDVTMVYSLNIKHLYEDNELDLCWRVDYKIENSAAHKGAEAYKSVLINAITGEECSI